MKLAISALAVALALGEAPTGQHIYAQEDGVSIPVPIKRMPARYTHEAMVAGIEGLVLLESVVFENGTVGNIKVVRSLDEGLDQEAITALQQWKFRPGTKDGKPVAVRITCEMTFSIKKDPRPTPR